jgi:hypothetical protein
MIEAIGFDTVWRETRNLRHRLISMTNLRALAAPALALAASLLFASSALGASAGDEYLPQIPTSGSGAGAAVDQYFPDGRSAVNSGSSESSSNAGGQHARSGSGSAQQAGKAEKPAKQRKASKRRQAAVLASDNNGDGTGGGSGSILLSPLVLLMIGAVLAAALGMTLSRGRGDASDGDHEHGRQGPRRETSGARTPEGEIVAGPDQIS